MALSGAGRTVGVGRGARASSGRYAPSIWSAPPRSRWQAHDGVHGTWRMMVAMTACRSDACQARSGSARTRVSTGKQREHACGALGGEVGMGTLRRRSVRPWHSNTNAAPQLEDVAGRQKFQCTKDVDGIEEEHGQDESKPSRHRRRPWTAPYIYSLRRT